MLVRGFFQNDELRGKKRECVFYTRNENSVDWTQMMMDVFGPFIPQLTAEAFVGTTFVMGVRDVDTMQFTSYCTFNFDTVGEHYNLFAVKNIRFGDDTHEVVLRCLKSVIDELCKTHQMLRSRLRSTLGYYHIAYWVPIHLFNAQRLLPSALSSTGFYPSDLVDTIGLVSRGDAYLRVFNGLIPFEMLGSEDDDEASSDSGSADSDSEGYEPGSPSGAGEDLMPRKRRKT